MRHKRVRRHASGGIARKILVIITSVIASLVLLFFLLVLLLPPKKITTGFVTLKDMQAYAAQHKELPPMENTNLFKPDYAKFWTKGWKQGFWSLRIDSLLRRLYLRKDPTWSADFFAQLVTRVTQERVQRGFKEGIAHKIVAKPEQRFIIFGDLQGAFYSLVRDLEELVKLGILDDKLKIVKPDHYIISTGNMVSRSPYSMETLSVLLRLWEENPTKVIYLRGNHETNNYWHGYSFKDEMIIKAGHLSKAQIPLGDEVNKFFDTLSIGVYIAVPPKTETDYVRINHYARDEPGAADETKFYSILAIPIKVTAPEEFEHFNINDVKQSGGATITIKASINAEKKRKTFQTMDGMRMLSPDRGASAWTFLSCPTTVYQLGVKFFYDAFGILQPAATIDQWIIELHNQDMRAKKGFSVQKYNLISGKSLEGGEDKKIEEAKDEKKDDAAAPKELPTSKQDLKATDSFKIPEVKAALALTTTPTTKDAKEPPKVAPKQPEPPQEVKAPPTEPPKKVLPAAPVIPPASEETIEEELEEYLESTPEQIIDEEPTPIIDSKGLQDAANAAILQQIQQQIPLAVPPGPG